MAALSMLAEAHLETASQALRATVQRIEERYGVPSPPPPPLFPPPHRPPGMVDAAQMQEILNPLGMEARRQKAAILYFKLMGMWKGDIDYCIRVRQDRTTKAAAYFLRVDSQTTPLLDA
jgi:hypothetical protein